jgi:hypothetical protein
LGNWDFSLGGGPLKKSPLLLLVKNKILMQVSSKVYHILKNRLGATVSIKHTKIQSNLLSSRYWLNYDEIWWVGLDTEISVPFCQYQRPNRFQYYSPNISGLSNWIFICCIKNVASKVLIWISIIRIIRTFAFIWKASWYSNKYKQSKCTDLLLSVHPVWPLFYQFHYIGN